MYKRLTALLLASAISLSLLGCGQQSPIQNNSNKLQAAFFAKGPAASLAKIDKEVMLPALALVEQIDLGKVKSDESQLKKLQSGTKRLKDEEIVRLNDAYLFFGKRYLQALEEYVKLSLAKEDNKARLFKTGRLEDAKLAFVNARNIVLNQKSLYKLETLEASQLHKGMTYEELRSLLQMPGEILETFIVTEHKDNSNKKIQPILWVYKGQYLYVEFVEGKSSIWKLQKGIAFGKKAERKVRNQLVAWDQEIVEPVWKLYEEYRNNKNKLAGQRIYNEAAAKKQKDEIERLLVAINESKKKLATIDKTANDFKIYFSYVELLIKEVEERMLCAQRIAGDVKDRKLLQATIQQGIQLEHRKIWRTYYVYCNLLKIKTEGKPNYQFPKWALKDFSNKPASGNLMHWFRMPSDVINKHFVKDSVNPKRWDSHEIHLWVQGNGYTYGYFVNDRLEKWQNFWVNDNFYHDM